MTSFERRVEVSKLARGHYRLAREDGRTIEIKKGGFGRYWYQPSNMVRRETLSAFKFDFGRGYL